jgi:hypothetical protein
MNRLLLLLPLAVLAGRPAWPQTTATIDIDATHATSLNPGFSGFNDEVTFPVEYYDTRFNGMAAQLSPGWVRYPSGLFSDAFNWQTGMMVPAWIAPFQGDSIYTLLTESVGWVNGKGGGAFLDASNRANYLGAKLIVDVNGYTDTPQSIGQMAAFAIANNIPVAVWELCNEPYFFSQFFSSGADYVSKMKPYRDAIKAADPNAVVAIFFSDAGNTNPNPPWDTSIGSYTDKYWDAVTYHHYPPQSTGPFAQWMADENAVLVTKTSAYVTGHLAPLNPPGMKFLISEFLPSSDGLGSGTSITDGTLYGAVYAAEYMMRMSSLPSMLYVGMHALSGTRGVDAANPHYADVTNAYNSGTTIDTTTLNFGFFFEAQPMGLAVLNGALKSATTVLSTTVTGGAQVPATGVGQIPALYAQAYSNGSGQQSVAITNKSAVPHSVTIRLNGAAVAGTFQVSMISGTDPTAVNTAANPNAVAIEASVSANPVTVPPYSVVRVVFQPGAPVPLFPAAGATGVVTAPLLAWNAVPGATSYEVYFGTSPAPPAVATTSGNNYAPGSLNPGTVFYWQVVAQGPGGSTASPVWSFTTGPAPPPGLNFVPVAPCRVADTRNANGAFGGPPIAGGTSRSFAIPLSACNIPATAQAYSLNVTVVPHGSLSYLTLWPTGENQPFVSTLNSPSGEVVANAAIVPAGTGGAVSVYATDTTDAILDIDGYFDTSSGPASYAFYAATPCRVADTRGPSGQFGGPSMTAGQSRDFPVPLSSCPIPATARAYSMNVTVVPSGPLYYLTLWPTGQPQPFVSTLNSWGGTAVANAALVPAGANESISVFVTNPTDVILDTNGYFAAPGAPGALTFYPVPPCRVADTRAATGPFGGPEMGATETRSFTVPGSACNIPATAAAYSLNVTVVPDGYLGYLSAWPAGSPQPVVSTLNSWEGSVTANAAIVPAGAAGAIDVFVTNPTHVILDIDGYFAP